MLQVMLENVFYACKSIQSGFVDVKSESALGQQGVSVFGKMISLVPAVGGVAGAVTQAAGAIIKAKEHTNRLALARSIGKAMSRHDVDMIKDTVSVAITDRYAEQLARLATPGDVAPKGRFLSWLKNATKLVGGDAAAFSGVDPQKKKDALDAVQGGGGGALTSAVDAATSVAKDIGVDWELLGGVGGAIAAEGGAGSKHPIPFAETLADYIGLWLVRSLESIDMQRADVLMHPERLASHMIRYVCELKPDAAPSTGGVGSMVSRVIQKVKRKAGSDTGGLVVYAKGEDGAYVEWTLHDVFTRPGIRTPDGCFGGQFTEPRVYGYLQGTVEEAQKSLLVKVDAIKSPTTTSSGAVGEEWTRERVAALSAEQVGELFASLSLARAYEVLLAEHCIDGAALVELTTEDLFTALSIPLGDGAKVKKALGVARSW